MKKNMIKILIFTKVNIDKDTRKDIIYIIFLKLITYSLALIPAYLTKLIFDDFLPSFDLRMLIIIIVILSILFISISSIEYFIEYKYINTLNNINEKFRNIIINSYLKKDIFSMQNYSSEELIYRSNQDVSTVVNLFISLVVNVVFNFLFFLIIIYILLKINIILSLTVFSFILIKTTYNYLVSNKFKSKTDQVKKAEANLIQFIKEMIDRLLFIKLNRINDYEINRYTRVLREFLQKNKNFLLFRALNSKVNNVIASFSQTAIIVIGAFLINDNQLTIGLLLAFLNLMQRALSPVEYLTNTIFSYKDLLSSFERITPFLDIKKDNNLNIVIKKDEQDFHLECKNVSCTINTREVINEFNLKVNQGQKIAIVGKSGSGKSTICKVIAGVLPYQGIIDLQPVPHTGNPEIGFLVDRSSIFRGTIRENLTYGIDTTNFSDNDLYNILNDVCLKDLVITLQMGLDTLIDENMLSKGEKQRLEIGRIMLVKPQLIILDEPTSGLDKDTEKFVWENFRKKCNGSTIIYTTHNLNIIYPGDEIVKIDNLEEVFTSTSRDILYKRG